MLPERSGRRRASARASAQGQLGHGGRIVRVVVGEPLLPGRRPRGEEGAGLGQLHRRAEPVGHGPVHAADHRPGRVVEVDHDLGDPLGIDLGEIPGGGGGPVGVLVRSSRLRSARAQEDDQIPGAVELGMLEEAAVHQHQVVAGSGTVGGAFHPWPGRVEEAERVECHATATAATGGQRTTEVVGDGARRGADEAVDRDMDRRSPADGDDGGGERLHDLGTSGRFGFDRRVHPGRPSGTRIGGGS
jgi:hypothetical protein